MVRASSLFFYCLIGSAAGALDSGEIVGIAGGATAGVGLLGATVAAAVDKGGAPAPAPEAPAPATVPTCGTYTCTTVDWVKKNITGIESLPASEITCCEAACGIVGKPPCQQFGVVEPQANAKKAGSSASSAGSFDESSGSSANSFNSSSDSFGSGSNGSDGSDKRLLWLIPLLLCLCCLIPLLLWLLCSGEKKKPKKKAVTKEAAPAPLLASSEPMATVAFDTNNDGNANFLVTGVDRNRDGIPDALQDESYVMPETTAGVDTSGDGVANYNVQGVDILRNGIPDFSRQQFITTGQPVASRQFIPTSQPVAARPMYGTYTQSTYGYTPMAPAQAGYVV